MATVYIGNIQDGDRLHKIDTRRQLSTYRRYTMASVYLSRLMPVSVKMEQMTDTFCM